VSVVLDAGDREIDLTYDSLPQPDKDGLFVLGGQPYVVVPVASRQELDRATIDCVGERLYAYLEARLGLAPADLAWDEGLARAWLPLDEWMEAFLLGTPRHLDATNWLSRRTHLRRLGVPTATEVVVPGQHGRVCPFEMPEGPRIGHVFTVAQGAEIRDQRLVVVDKRPEATLGLSASAIPLLEHGDPNRALMGANMLRQWVPQSTPEPALVQTGAEPAELWAGRNLLTAYVSWGADTFDDGILISESCARRFDTPYALEPGDKLSNRHGIKGVVSRVLPDAQMPHLPDGTPVELVYNFSGLHLRLSMSPVLEAVLGRIARARGEPVLAPPFGAPSADQIHAWLDGAGLPASAPGAGMETLTLGAEGPPLGRPSTVGWVYWGRLTHLARSKVRTFVDGRGGQIRGEMEQRVLGQIGCTANQHEGLNTAASRRVDAETLAARVAAGPIEPAGPPSPLFAELVARLRIGGIEATLQDGTSGEELALSWLEPRGSGGIQLVRPVPHPWLRERALTEIGAYEGLSELQVRSWSWSWISSWGPSDASTPAEAYDQVAEANERLARLLAGGAPESLVQDAHARLAGQVDLFFDLLLVPQHLRFSERMLFSARTVIAPGAKLATNQMALPDEIAWALYGPLLARQTGIELPVDREDARVQAALEAAMARTWVIVNRAPSLSPTAHLAFHPVRDPGSVIRLHPLVTGLLDADFDGDQVAVFLPLTEAAQREAGERLTVAAHLARDPGLIETVLPPPEAIWGLAYLGLDEAGRREVSERAGVEVRTSRGLITRATLAEAMRRLLAADGPAAVLAALERLMVRGLQVVQASGASMSAFIGQSLARPPMPVGDDPAAWETYHEALAEQILSGGDYDDLDLGAQRLAVNVRARGRAHLVALIVPAGPVVNAEGATTVIRHSRVEGLTPDELFAKAAGARQGLAELAWRWEGLGREMRAQDQPEVFTLLARARRAQHPGIVFARAAADGEVDPLEERESRLLVGLQA
jgi:hypothetical protein